MDSPMQVHDFLNGIKSTSYSHLKGTILMHPETKGDLAKAITMFKGAVRLLHMVSGDKQEPKERKVSATQSGEGRYHGQYLGGGRGYGNRGGWFHEGRGRGRGRGRGQNNYRGSGHGQGSCGNNKHHQDNKDRLNIDQKVLDQMRSKQQAVFFQGQKWFREGTDDRSERNGSPGITHAVGSTQFTGVPPPEICVESDQASWLSNVSSHFGPANQNQSLQGGNGDRNQGSILSPRQPVMQRES